MTTQPLSSPTAEPEYFYIQHVLSGYVMAPKVTGPQDAEGQSIHVVPVEPDRPTEYQLWSRTGDGLLVNKATGLVMDIAGRHAAVGAALIQSRARGAGPDRSSQRWHITPEGWIEPMADHHLVVVTNGVSEPKGAMLVEKRIPAQPEQQWRRVTSVLPAPNLFFIEHVPTRSLLTPAGGMLDAGTVLAVEPGSVSYPARQLWSWVGDGMLSNDAARLVADVKANDLESGEVVLWQAKDGEGDARVAPNQAWTYGPDGTVGSGLGKEWVLEATGPAGGQGPVRVARASGAPDQQWRVRRAVYPEPVFLARAVHLNGTNQALALDDIGPALEDFTAEAWVRTSTGGPVVTSYDTTTGHTVVALAIGLDGSLTFAATGTLQRGWTGTAVRRVTTGPVTASVTTGPTAAVDGEWHHVAATWEAGVPVVYLDGVAVAPADRFAPPDVARATSGMRFQFGTIRSGNGLVHRDWLDGDLAEIRLWKRALAPAEIPAGMHHRIDDTDPDLAGHWTFSGDDGRDSSLARRHATLVGAPAFLNSDVEVVPQGDFYLITQARLLQDWIHAPEGEDEPVEIDGYRVTANIRDGNDQPTPGFLTIALNNPTVTPTATLHRTDGTSVVLDADHPQAQLSTDLNGQLSFTLDAEGQLICPPLRVQADFMTDGSWLVVAPDRQAHAALAGITGNDLRGLDANGQKLPDRTAPLPDKDAATADAAAAAISQTISTAVQHNTQADQPQVRLLSDLVPAPTVRPYLPRYQVASLVAAGHDPATDTIATHHVDRDAPVARILVPDNADHAHWSYDFTTFTPHSTDQAARELTALASLSPVGDLAEALLPDFGPGHITGATPHQVTAGRFTAAAAHDVMTTTGLTSWLKDHVAKAARILVNTIETTVVDEVTGIERKVKQMVVTAIDALEHAEYALIQAVEHAVDVVAGFLEKLGSDIKKIVAFLKALFDWGDVVNTQRILYAYVSNLRPYVTDLVRDGAHDVSTALATLKEDVDHKIHQIQDKVMGAGGQKEVNKTATSPPRDVKSSYLTTMTGSNIQKAKVPPDLLAETPLEELIRELGEEWVAAVGNAWAHLPQQIAATPIGKLDSPQTYFTAGVELMLGSVQAVVDDSVDSIAGMVESIETRIDGLLAGTFELLTREIDIPVVTPFYEKVVMHGTDEKLNVLGLATLAAAMEVTFTYKLATGERPFTKEEADWFCELGPDDYTWLVNPFRPRRAGDAANSVAVPFGKRHDILVSGFNLAGDVAGMVGGGISDLVWSLEQGPLSPRLSDPFRRLLGQMRYQLGKDLPASIIAGVAIGSNYLYVVAGSLDLNKAARDDGSPKSIAFATLIEYLNVVGFGLSLVGNFIEYLPKVDKPEEWMDLVTLAMIGVDIDLGIAVVVKAAVIPADDKKETVIAVFNGLSWFILGFGQLVKWLVAEGSKPITPLQVALLNCVNLAGYLGTSATDAAILGVKAKALESPRHDSHTNPGPQPLPLSGAETPARQR